MQRASLLAGSVLALTLAACGGGGSTTGGGGSGLPTTTPTATPAGTSSPAATQVLVTTLTSGTQGPGFTLYTLSDDTTTTLACTVASGCTGLWIPYSAGATVADESAAGLSSGLSVFARSDNSALQWAIMVSGVAHPLYTYAGDSTTGVATGVGIVSFGGTWVAPSPPAAGSATISGEPDAGSLATPAPTAGPTATPGSPYIRNRNPF
jgi:predicted lipoprotein with Yx(FWY)xxD motif